VSYPITSLTTGTEYFVRVSARNTESYGTRQLTSPSSAKPMHNAPSAPLPVVLDSSDSNQISVSWEAPTVNGGAAVTGYEL
ncbi:hypothetical protein TL16_g00219, partial [Triparma laevis f. inornata]